MECEYPSALPYGELPADEIRLLKVRPGNLGSPIACQLFQTPLTRDIKYIALSYVWGNPSVTKTILINDQPFEITTNLSSALDQLRSSVPRFSEHFVWVDAICINQEDIGDKERQIPRMADIYRQALKVLGWLGPVDSSEDEAIEAILSKAISTRQRLLAHIAEHSAEIDNDQSSLGRLRHQWFQESSRQAEFGNCSQSFSSSLRALLARPWFRRRWIVQEICAPERAPDLCIGRHIIDLDLLYTLHEITNFISHKISLSFVILTELKTTRDIYRSLTRRNLQDNVRSNQILLAMLTRASLTKATKSHDYIYSFLGLCDLKSDNNASTVLRPDYQKPYEQVCYDVVTKLVIETGDLRLLNNSGVYLSGMPSWVPDFRRFSGRIWKPFVDPSSVTLSADGQVLSVKGKRLGVCKAVMSADRASVVGDDIKSWIYRRIKKLEDLFARASSLQVASIDALRNKWLGMWYRTATLSSGTRALYQALQEQTPVDFKASADAVPALQSILKVGCVVVSDGSVMAIKAPAKEGDMVSIFLGGCCIYVVRPNGTEYQVVANCMLHSGFSVGLQLQSKRFWKSQEPVETIHLV